ncbi:MAG: SufS family cysteine desulfurase [Pseudomonadota bacterium]|nr:SufS family cysteine desulfurase [Pseudomonadota bacterium]
MWSEKEINEIREMFPALKQKVRGQNLVYLDSAATALKPLSVSQAIFDFDSVEASNVHRGAHYLSGKATERFEGTRDLVKQFLNAGSADEIIFTSGTTEGINLVANSFVSTFCQSEDEIVVTEMEHHSNFVPWQKIAKEKNLKFKVIPVKMSGELDLEMAKKIITDKTKIVALSYVSNVLGNINPIKKIIALAKASGAKTLIDAAQAVPAFAIDVQDLDCDFLVFSAHKLYGPFGVGVLYGRKKILQEMSPWKSGGGMIDSVTSQGSTYADVPNRFEAGTPNISGVIGLGVALNFVRILGYANISEYEGQLHSYLLDRISDLKSINVYGETENKVGIIGFNMISAHASDVGSILDQLGIAVRSGHHCAQPLMTRFAVPAMVRCSLGVYNTTDEIDRFVQGLNKAQEMLL